MLSGHSYGAVPVRLKGAVVDTSRPKREMRIPLSHEKEPRYYIIQSQPGDERSMHDAASAAGARIVSYLPEHAYLVEIEANRLGRSSDKNPSAG